MAPPQHDQCKKLWISDPRVQALLFAILGIGTPYHGCWGLAPHNLCMERPGVRIMNMYLTIHPWTAGDWHPTVPLHRIAIPAPTPAGGALDRMVLPLGNQVSSAAIWSAQCLVSGALPRRTQIDRLANAKSLLDGAPAPSARGHGAAGDASQARHLSPPSPAMSAFRPLMSAPQPSLLVPVAEALLTAPVVPWFAWPNSVGLRTPTVPVADEKAKTA